MDVKLHHYSENSLSVPQKVKHRITMSPSISTPLDTPQRSKEQPGTSTLQVSAAADHTGALGAWLAGRPERELHRSPLTLRASCGRGHLCAPGARSYLGLGDWASSLHHSLTLRPCRPLRRPRHACMHCLAYRTVGRQIWEPNLSCLPKPSRCNHPAR